MLVHRSVYSEADLSNSKECLANVGSLWYAVRQIYLTQKTVSRMWAPYGI